jgi:hypothetical protein
MDTKSLYCVKATDSSEDKTCLCLTTKRGREEEKKKERYKKRRSIKNWILYAFPIYFTMRRRSSALSVPTWCIALSHEQRATMSGRKTIDVWLSGSQTIRGRSKQTVYRLKRHGIQGHCGSSGRMCSCSKQNWQKQSLPAWFKTISQVSALGQVLFDDAGSSFQERRMTGRTINWIGKRLLPISRYFPGICQDGPSKTHRKWKAG